MRVLTNDDLLIFDLSTVAIILSQLIALRTKSRSLTLTKYSYGKCFTRGSSLCRGNSFLSPTSSRNHKIALFFSSIFYEQSTLLVYLKPRRVFSLSIAWAAKSTVPRWSLFTKSTSKDWSQFSLRISR